MGREPHAGPLAADRPPRRWLGLLRLLRLGRTSLRRSLPDERIYLAPF